jgi:integrase
VVKGQVHVMRSVTRGVITEPKSNRARVVPLSEETRRALKAHRHLRGELVFCTTAGRMFRKNETKHPLWRACRKAGLRRIGWHCLRHSFASHLVMRGVALKAVQELVSHATMKMTMRYAHLSPHVTRDAVQLLDRPLQPGCNGGRQPRKRLISRRKSVEAPGVEPLKPINRDDDLHKLRAVRCPPVTSTLLS